tara:strand:- start:88 stop:195 length:108 start_codon:yes stop_codon:yes gene_type:complete
VHPAFAKALKRRKKLDEISSFFIDFFSPYILEEHE